MVLQRAIAAAAPASTCASSGAARIASVFDNDAVAVKKQRRPAGKIKMIGREFTPAAAGVVARGKVVRRDIEHLLNTDFWESLVFAALAAERFENESTAAGWNTNPRSLLTGDRSKLMLQVCRLLRASRADCRGWDRRQDSAYQT